MSANCGKSANSCGRRRFELAAEARHAFGHVGLEADAALLAVVRDVDAGVELLTVDVSDTVLDGGGERVAVDALPQLGANQQVIEGVAPRQASDMGHQNAVFALAHAPSPPPPRRAARSLD